MSEAEMKAGRGLWRSKWRWIAAYWVVQAVVIHLLVSTYFTNNWIPSVSDVLSHATEPIVIVIDSILAAAITSAQAVLLIPVRRPRMGVHTPGLRLVHSVVGGAAVAGVTWLALWPLMLLLSVVGIGDHAYDVIMRSPLGWVLPLAVAIVVAVFLWGAGRDGLPVQLSVGLCALAATLLFTSLVGGLLAIPRLLLKSDDWNEAMVMALAGALFGGWIIATPIVWAFVKKRGTDDGLARLSSRLFLGTMIETACLIPLDVMVRRKSSCYCEETTYWSLAACWSVGFFAFGPVIFLVPLSKRRKRWYAGRCEACGYDMTGCMAAERCPECGAGWKPAPADAP